MSRHASSLKDICRYFALIRLGGRSDVEAVLYMYFVLGMSPSEISKASGVRLTKVRGILGTAKSRLRVPVTKYGLLRLVISASKAVEPIIDGGVCRVCNARVGRWGCLHVAVKHREELESATESVAKRVLEVVGRCARTS